MVDRREFLLGTVAGSCWVATAAKAAVSAPELRAHIAREMQKAKIPGLQAAVIRNGKVVFQASFGLADIENSVPVTDSTVFQIASCTKAFVAVAVMQLVENGKLDLDAALSRYLKDLPPPWQVVTVGQLASHTSGLPDLLSDLNSLRLLVEGDAEASLAKAQTLPMEFAPGERFSYIQTNYVLLGKIIDAVAGMPFIEFIRKYQLDPVAMPRTVYGDDHDVVPHSARTYTTYLAKPGKPPEHTGSLYKVYTEFQPILRTCGGLNTTATEMARWIVALNGGKLLKRASSLCTLLAARLLNNGTAGPAAMGGFAIARPAHPAFLSVGAAKSAFAIYPDDDLAVVVLSNLSADMGLPFVDGIATYYFGDSQTRHHRYVYRGT